MADDDVPASVKAECRYLASFESTGHKIVRLFLGVVLTLLGLLAVQGVFSLYSWSHTHYNSTPIYPPDAHNAAVGTGTVTSCERFGPMRTVLLFPGWDCYVHVKWNAGTPAEGTYSVPGNVFSNDQVGRQFSVIQYSEQRGRFNRHVEEVSRNLETPYTWTFVPSLFVFGILAFVFGGTGIGRLLPYATRLQIYDNERKKLRAKLERDGRIPANPAMA